MSNIISINVMLVSEHERLDYVRNRSLEYVTCTTSPHNLHIIVCKHNRFSIFCGKENV